MNISVNIGSSQDFRLSRALLVGKSSYDGYPYRHPFVTLHEVSTTATPHDWRKAS